MIQVKSLDSIFYRADLSVKCQLNVCRVIRTHTSILFIRLIVMSTEPVLGLFSFLASDTYKENEKLIHTLIDQLHSWRGLQRYVKSLVSPMPFFIGASRFMVLISPAAFTKGLALMKTIPIEGGLFSVGSTTYAACRLNSLATLSLEYT